MNIQDIIRKKKHGEKLSRMEIEYFTEGFTRDEIPDYQISALLMAIWFSGMDEEETRNLTESSVNSGDVVDLSSIPGIKVDKHSTGGVGDKVSLIVIPVVASLGIPVAKLSGRGLGHTGGTIDKLEAIPGFSCDLSLEKFKESVRLIGAAIASQTGNLTPADKKFYALRDVTETVDSIPLIASSVMGKKIASGSDAIVLDVKTGEGAFMKTDEDAALLAEEMVKTGNSMGRRTVAVLTDMNEPLGRNIGNSLEIEEAVKVLKGDRIPGLWDVSLTVASLMVILGGLADNLKEAGKLVEESIDTGKAINKFREIIKNQGGDERVTDDPSIMGEALYKDTLYSEKSGYITAIKAMEIGMAAVHIGAGREKKGDNLDYTAGIELIKTVGEKVQAGESLAVLKHNRKDIAESLQDVLSAYVIEDNPPDKKDYIHRIIGL